MASFRVARHSRRSKAHSTVERTNKQRYFANSLVWRRPGRILWMAVHGAETSYNEVPYEGGLVERTHPQHLAVLGTLFGMQPTDVRHCRVLEIGCAIGANLLPMAYSLPESEFVGIDPSSRQIEMGHRMMDEYGVKNLKLIVADVRDLESWTETFDYIICHGVLTWVPPEVQEAIFAACRKLLAPQGIAYISYNALPGFHLRAGIGEMMRYHARNFGTPGERTDQATALLDFLVQSTASFKSDNQLDTYHRVLKRESEILHATPSYYLLHEHLVDEPSAFYLHEFLEFASAHDLQYLGDTDLHTMMLKDLPDAVGNAVNAIAPNQIALEQYRDFVVNRMFRRSLVCRDDVDLQRHISIDAIKACCYRARVSKDPEHGWLIPKVGGVATRVTDPTVAAVLEALDDALPLALSFDDLAGRLGKIEPVEEELLSAILLSLLSLDAVSFRTWSPEVASEIGERPLAFWPARKLAALGERHIPNAFHESNPEEPFICKLAALLDGTRTQTELAEAMKALIDNGEVTFEEQPAENPSQEEVLRLVTDGLDQLRRKGILVTGSS